MLSGINSTASTPGDFKKNLPANRHCKTVRAINFIIPIDKKKYKPVSTVKMKKQYFD